MRMYCCSVNANEHSVSFACAINGNEIAHVRLSMIGVKLLICCFRKK